MDKVLENGKEVLLFHQTKGNVPDELNFIKGTIVRSEKKEYPCLRGSSLTEQLYTIKDEEGNIYQAIYGNSIQGYFIRTIEDHLKYIRIAIKNNIQVINSLNDYNDKLNNVAYYLLEQKESKMSK